jgi:type IV pilus assembly protein PilB
VGNYPDIETIKSILLRESYISEEDSNEAEAASRTSEEYVAFLIHKETLDKRLFGQALAEYYGIAFIDLESTLITKESITKIPEEIARKLRIIYIKKDHDTHLITTDLVTTDNMKRITALFKGKNFKIGYSLSEYIENCFKLYEQPLETRFSAIIKDGQRIAPEILDEIIKDALNFRASDIHFEPGIDTLTVRFRVDGTLRQAGILPKSTYENVLNRIKLEAGMRIDEHFTAQDGAIQRTTDAIKADFRVSLIPTIQGEKIVMRILSSYIQDFSLKDIGLSEANQKMIEEYAAKPFGMILAVGPTGSGKTTTLYTLIKLLSRPNVNITTIEDPVEYKMPGINQIQVREASHLTFAHALRSIVRQDPDIILVGEIRDKETAEVSVNAALTGHLLLSTFHSNDAQTAIPRLIDMGIEPFLLASTLEIIIAQRLVRTICSHCKYSLLAGDAIDLLTVHKHEISSYFKKTDNIYAGKGCSMCNNTGYKGRSALYELIPVTPAMQELIITSPSSREIGILARSEGSMTMFEDGIAKVRSGATTISEVLRVVEPPAITTKKGKS